MRKADYNSCLVLDSSYMARSVIHSARAFVIHLKGNAEVLHEHPVSFGLVRKDLDIKKPSVIKVGSYIKALDGKVVTLSRENVFKRDEYRCVYCERTGKRNLTLDHVIPRSKGGKDTWENLVTSCFDCNQEKADLSLEEVGYANPDPKRPHFLMLMKSVNYIYDDWRQYLFY